MRVYQPGTTETTAAFDELAEIVEAIDAYPILDESDYSDRQYESALAGIDCMMIGDVPRIGRRTGGSRSTRGSATTNPSNLKNC